MSKRKSAHPPPNQLSIKAFISGGSRWKAGDSPLTERRQEQSSSEELEFEKGIHDKIMSAGIFLHFQNQPAALSYLNGQLTIRKNHLTMFKKLEKSVSNFEKSGLTK